MPAAGFNHKLWIQWREHSGGHHELRCNGKFGGCKAEELALRAVGLGIFVGLRHDLERNKQEVAREKMVAGLGLCQTLGPTPCSERGGGPCFQQSGNLRSEDSAMTRGAYLESWRKEVQKAFVDTTRIDRRTWSPPLVVSDWSALCHTLYDGCK